MTAGWYLLDHHNRAKVWHYFRQEATRSICGGAFAFEVRGADRLDRVSSLSMMKAPHCKRCAKTRVPEETRAEVRPS